MRGERGASRVAGGPVVWWRHNKRHARGKGPGQGLGAKGTRGERTRNMEPMERVFRISYPTRIRPAVHEHKFVNTRSAASVH